MEQKKRGRKPGAWRGWVADLSPENLLAPMDPEDLDAAEGKFTDEFGITKPNARSDKEQR